MTSPSDRSARAFAALATALGITIGVAPNSLFAQSVARPSSVEQQKGAVQNKGATIEATQSKDRSAVQNRAQQNKAEQAKREQLEAQQSLWRYGVLLMLGALVAESVVGRR